MRYDKRGQSLGIAIIVAITLFMVGLVSINFLMPEVTTARNSDNLDCSNSTANNLTSKGISDSTKLTCLAVDLAIPYFILLIIASAGGFIVSRFLI